MSKKIVFVKKYILPSLFIVFFLVNTAFATGLVPCGPGVNNDPDSQACTLCHLLILLKNIVDFLTEVAFALVAVMILYGALMFFIAGGQEAKIRQGREIITTAIYGLAIVLLSWVIINTVVQVFVAPGSLPNPWNEIECDGWSY